MSWSRLRHGPRAALLAVVLIIGLAGCGFEPLHGQNTASSADALEAVRINVIADRVGQQLRNRLLQLMQPRANDTRPAWNLRVELNESISTVLVEESSFGTRGDLKMTAIYRLVPVTGNMAAARNGRSFSVASFNIRDADLEYANLIAERDAREKAVRLLADDIKRQVALWLRQADNAGS